MTDRVVNAKKRGMDRRGMKRMINTKPARQSGFTLIELLVALAVIAVLVMTGGPSFTDLIRNNRVATQTNALMRSLQLARSEAVKRGRQVTVCKSANQTACTTSGNWEQGWIVFVDNNGDGVINAGEDIVRVQATLPASYTIRVGANFADWVGYLANGLPEGSGSLDNDTFKICADNNVKYSRHLIVSISGRARMIVGTTCS